MAELIVGPIIDMLIKFCFENLQDHLKRHKGMKKELERLRDNYSKIQAVVSAASEADIKDQNPALNKWLWQLRDAIDDADDLLDEFVYMKHEKELAKNKEETKIRSTSKIIKESASKIHKVAKGFFKTDSYLKRLEEVVQKLDKILTEVSKFRDLSKDAKQMQQVQDHELLKARSEGCFRKSTLIGREKDKEYVMQWLRKPVGTDITTNKLYSNISLLSIVGDGGMGKTSLLQHVYQDEMTKDFDPKIWVCVSNHFDIKKLIADMLESSKEDRPSLDNISALQERLKSKVMSKKFLLVLDDIWEEELYVDKWEKVLAPLAHGSLGSKILITTRMDSVAKMISEVIEKKMKKLTLEGLEEEECLRLLKSHAFANVENQDEYKQLECISGEFVKKLYGSPLAAKVIGGVLNKKLDESHWKNVLKNSALGRNEILPILKLSYTFLPKELQNCFTFCSIFPQDHEFDRDDLVRMWIAVGFIQPSDIQDGEDLEDVGRRYFDLLVQKSFFDKVDDKYHMHDLLHDVARSISAQECFRFEGDQKLFTRVPETIRHLSVDTSNVEVLRNLGKFKHLRTLWITYNENIQDFDDVLTTIFKETRSIRLLYIDNYYPEELILETIGYLMHLRYLSLDFGDLTLFPKPLCNLYHLQYIIRSGYGSPRLCDDFFPRDMSNLSNLRHTSFYSLKFPGIGKLKFLQDPIIFFVKHEIGYSIGELKHMNDLRILDINGLENVRDAEEACNAKLCDKQKLTNLSLNWGKEYNHFTPQDERGIRINIADPDLDERVLDNLRPHHDLKVLKMHSYMGVRSAKWMNETYLNYNLEEIELRRCLEWQNLPPFGQLRFLKVLELHDMPKVKRLNDMRCIFQSLERLKIDRLEALEDWFGGGVKAEADCLFPCLTYLTLKNCPNLQELPYLPPQLKTSDIENIGWKTLNCCSISKSVPLETLEVSHCPNITYIFLAGEIGRVKIEDCPNLIYLGGHQEVETIGNIPCLTELTLEDCPNLQELTNLPPKLKTLKIRNIGCKTLNCRSISKSIALERLDVRQCSNITYFFLAGEIGTVYIEDCPNLIYFGGHEEVEIIGNIPASVESSQCLPSSVSTIYSLKQLFLESIPLKSFPDLPPSLCELYLENLDNLDCLPSCLPTLSSLCILYITKVPKLRELPDLPPSLYSLHLENLDNLDCLPSCLPILSSLKWLSIKEVPKLRELPDLPPSLNIEDVTWG